MWFSAQGAGRDGVTNMDVVASALAEVGRVLVVVVGLREGGVAVAGLDVVGVRDGDTVAESAAATVLVKVQPIVRCPMLAAHGYPPEDERAHREPLT